MKPFRFFLCVCGGGGAQLAFQDAKNAQNIGQPVSERSLHEAISIFFLCVGGAQLAFQDAKNAQNTKMTLFR